MAKRARSASQTIRTALAEHQTSMSTRLTEARARDEQFRNEIKAGFEVMTKGLAELSEAMRLQMAREAELRQREADARARENAHTDQLLSLLTASLLHTQPLLPHHPASDASSPTM
jgi:hypothetical protein